MQEERMEGEKGETEKMEAAIENDGAETSGWRSRSERVKGSITSQFQMNLTSCPLPLPTTANQIAQVVSECLIH